MNNQTLSKQEDKINIKKLFSQIFSFWHIYLITLILVIVGIKLYLRYTDTIYTAYSTVLVRDSKNKSNADALLQELNLFNTSKNIANEKGIITSYNMVATALEKLNFDISYFIEGRIKKQELYKENPFTVYFIAFDDSHVDKEIQVEFSNDKLHLVNEYNGTHDTKMTIHFGDTISLANGLSLVFSRNPQFNFRENATYSFRINDMSTLVKRYVSKLKISLLDKESTILKLQSSGPVLEKEIDFINQLAYEYVQSDLTEKNNIARNTILFIDTQLKEVTESLQGAELKLRNFRQSNNLMDLSLSSTNLYEQIDELNRQKADLVVKDKYYHYLLDYLEKNNEINNLVAPSSMGIEDPLLINLINDLNNLYLERSALEFSVSDKNPSINTTNRKIANQKATLIENVKNIIASSRISINELNDRLEKLSVTFRQLPDNERQLVRIQRQFSLNEEIYNYLLEKRAEVGIARAGNSPDNKVIDYAKIDPNSPPSPNTRQAYLIGLILAFFIPTGLIFLKELLNDKVSGKDDLESIIQNPIAGIIGHSGEKTPWPIANDPKSVIAESFRSLRTNLQYLKGDNKEAKIIGITSAMSGEGKTFCSLNLASIMALVSEKVLIIGGDMRKPRLGDDLDVRMDWGLSDLLVGNASAEEIIQPTSFKNLFIISAGNTPPNPSELLNSSKFSEALGELRKTYDYIIIDSPPIGLVTDYFVMRKYIDLELFVVRNNYTSKNLLIDIFKSQSMSQSDMKTYYILNDCKTTSIYGYGYGYGNGYYGVEKKQSWKDRLFGKK